MAKKYEYNKENFITVDFRTPKNDTDFIALEKYLENQNITFSSYVKELISNDMKHPQETIERPTKTITTPLYWDVPYEEANRRRKIIVRKGSEMEQWILSKPKKATYILSLILQDIQKNRKTYCK